MDMDLNRLGMVCKCNILINNNLYINIQSLSTLSTLSTMQMLFS